MKKILISDYDETIFQDEETTKNNILAINKFRKKHVFSIATGRSYDSFKKAIDEFNIKCDFYILNYGAEILDSKFNLINSITLKEEELDEIEEFFEKKNCKLEYCLEKESVDKRKSCVYKVIVKYKKKEDLLKDYKVFSKNSKYNLFILKNHPHLEIVPKSVNKSYAVDFVSRYADVYDINVIGDSESDIDMVKKYNGSSVKSNCLELEKVSRKTYLEFSDYVNELLKENKVKNIAIIYNPESGKHNNGKFIKYVSKLMEEHNYNGMFCPTQRKADATEIIKHLPEDLDIVLVAGGDGTLNEAINGNCMRKNRLAIAYIPFGTTNDVGKMYGFTKNYIKDLEVLFDGVFKQIDVCYINSKAFVYVACAGNYMNVSYETPRRLKKRYGKMGYAIYALKQITKKVKSYDLKYKVNGIEKEGNYSFMFITNTSRIAGQNGIYKDVKLDDRMFEVVFAKAKKKKEMVKILYLLKTHNLEDIKQIEYYKTDKLEIEFMNDVPIWCLDGEKHEVTDKKYTFSVDYGTKMLMPKKNIDKLFEKK